MVIVFDLDDTLYDELTFAIGGLKQAAHYLSKKLQIPEKTIFSELKEELFNSRSAVFDHFLLRHQIKNKKLVRECVQIYRKHSPMIQLYPEAFRCLKRFKDYPLYLVTDGNHLVQRSKVKALKIAPYFKRCFYTNAHGVKYNKPSIYCFQKISNLEKVEPKHIVYIADNPYKDFSGLRKEGFKTIRILQGPYKNQNVENEKDAEIHLLTLDDVTKEMLMKVMK